MTDVSETEITLDTGIVILIDDVNAVMAYGPTKGLPILAGAACGYLGFFPGLCVTILIAPGFMEGGTDEIVGAITFLGTMVLSAIYAYKTTHRIVREKNQKMVYMDGALKKKGISLSMQYLNDIRYSVFDSLCN